MFTRGRSLGRWGLATFLLISLSGTTQGAPDSSILQLTDSQGREIAGIDEEGRVTLLEVRGAVPPEEPEAQAVDPDLQSGWPVKAAHRRGTYQGGQVIHTLVANIDKDSQLEILTTALAVGPLYGWNYNGTMLTGWPITPNSSAGAAYPAVGTLGPLPRKIMVAFFGCDGFSCTRSPLVGYHVTGKKMTGWPITSANYIASPPSLANAVAGGYDEIFVDEENWRVNAYRFDAVGLSGWPVFGWGGQRRFTPAIADLDKDGDLEVISATGWSTEGVRIHAYHHTGEVVAGFPVRYYPAANLTFPTIGDVDGDGQLEIVVVAKGLPRYSPPPSVRIYSAQGVLERTIRLPTDLGYGTAPALADLDGNGVPEIVVQMETALYVFYGDGRPFPGWPVTWTKWDTQYWLGNSSPVVGDVDGDGKPDIVITTHEAGQGRTGEVHVYNAQGRMHPRFPKILPLGSGAVPAIADVDRDKRNEIVVCGSYWDGIAGMFPKCWVFDLKGGTYGRIEWGQFGGGPSHQFRYPVPDLP